MDGRRNHRQMASTPRIARRTACTVLLALAVLLSWSSFAFADVWTDISDATWQSVYHISAQDAKTVADGYPDGTFRPYNPVTRGQFAKMVSGGLSIPTLNPSTQTFTDVPPSYIFYIYIEGDAAAGVINGYPDDTYRPGLEIIRQQANSILGRWLSQAEILETGGIEGSEDNYPTLDTWYAAEGEDLLAGFADQGKVVAAHRATTAYLIMRQVVLGSSSGGQKYLMPLDKLGRAQAVAMTLRVEDAAESYLPTITEINPESGPLAGGQAVTITGSNFAGVTKVLFGTRPATNVVVSADGTEINCKTPSHAKGPVDVTVVTPVGTSAAVVYTYNDVPAGLHLQVAGIANPTAAGATSTVTVTALDAQDQVWTGYVGTIHFTSTDSSATLPSDFTFKVSDAGVHTFAGAVILKKAGPQTVTATDKATPSVTGFQAVTVTAGTATHLSVTGIPDPAVVSRPATVTVTAVDTFENTAPSYRGTIEFTSTDSSATLPGDYTFKAADNGLHSFPNAVVFKKVGTRTVTASDEASATVTGAQTVTVIAEPTTHFHLTGIADPVKAGVLSSLTVTALDAQNHTVQGYRGAVHFTSTDASATLPPDYHFVAADNGVHLFAGGVTLRTAGSQTVTATDAGASSVNGKQTVTVSPAALDRFVFNPISEETSGTAFPITITAMDSFENTKTDFNSTADLKDSTDTISPDSVDFAGGVFSGLVTIFKAQTDATITATYLSVTSVSNTFNVLP